MTPAGEHIAVVDLGYGDAGKGTVVDWLCATQPVHAVIRFNGGAQAGHNVLTPDGREHTFAQFGSGTLRAVPTFLSRFMVVDPLALVTEADHLATVGVPAAWGLLTVDRDALVATVYHRLANQARELARGADRHGSCGMGVGETVAHALADPGGAIRFGDLRDPPRLLRKLRALRAWLHGEFPQALAPAPQDCAAVFGAVADRVTLGDQSTMDRLSSTGTCVFEGAQGVLLDEWRGWHPYTTWSTTTFANVHELTDAPITRLGVLRTVTTRHGAGPLVTEDAALTRRIVDPRNHTGAWQGAFRVGHFDAVAHRYAIEVAGGVDALAVTHLDVVGPDTRICQAYECDGTRVPRLVAGPHRDLAHQAALTALCLRARPVLRDAPADWVEAVTQECGAPVVVTSHGPTSADKRVLRSARAPW